MTTPPTTTTTTLPTPILTTPRLLIRPYHPQDVTSTHAAASPASIHKYMSLAFAYPYTLQHAQTWVDMNLTPPFHHFVICEREKPDVAIGGIGAKPGIDVSSHTAELGYWIGEDYAGKGLMSEAVRAYVDWCFTEREHPPPAVAGAGGKLMRLHAGVFSGNAGSMRILQKTGFKPEGVWKENVEKHGIVYDTHFFGLTRRDWEEGRRKEA
ncbi:acyl-CoA N-acyltransferase [Periconia macrospinosa]|uniref:Acyl-CoA N-acyltransferase n=1 Tax=Periconia macrospinosa TaxID=97972 RepID=A0A2V1DYM9_9PLEO|nr:acyl-CoA N-acyltransferase [Periconia macrospinosa]